jgi:hypothetical protein
MNSGHRVIFHLLFLDNSKMYDLNKKNFIEIEMDDLENNKYSHKNL